MSRETKPKDKRKAAAAKTLEALVEQLMLEVAYDHPAVRGRFRTDEVAIWAHHTAIYISEILKRRAEPVGTIIKHARRAARRRVEREVADRFLAAPTPRPLQPLTGKEQLTGDDGEVETLQTPSGHGVLSPEGGIDNEGQ